MMRAEVISSHLKSALRQWCVLVYRVLLDFVYHERFLSRYEDPLVPS